VTFDQISRSYGALATAVPGQDQIVFIESFDMLRVERRVIDSIVIVDLTWTGPPGARVQHCVGGTSPTGSVGWRLTENRLVTTQRRVCNEVLKEEAASFARDFMRAVSECHHQS
jgi:hypothetical protein